MKSILSKQLKQILGLTISVWTSVIVKYPLLLFWIALLSSALTSQYRAAGILWSQGVGKSINKPSGIPNNRCHDLSSRFHSSCPFWLLPFLSTSYFVFWMRASRDMSMSCPWALFGSNVLEKLPKLQCSIKS